MPARKALIPLLFAAVLLPGCGGGDVSYEEVKLPPPTLTVPKDSGTTSTASAGKTPTPTPTPTTTPEASSGTSSSGTTGSTGGTSASGGTTSGGTTSGSGTTGTGGTGTQTQTQPQDTGGASPDEGLDQFCADNPGACDGNG
jgi:hypothetical protein